MTITLMIAYNFFYLCGKFIPQFIPGIVQPIYEAIRANGFTFTLLEVLGAISLFVDLVGGWDNRHGNARRRQLWVVVILILLFLFKFAIRMFESMLPEFN